GAALLLRDRERAELALHAADVRLVQIEVLDEVDLVPAPAQPAGQVCELAEPEQVVGLEERHAVVEVEPLAGLDLLPDRVERGDAVGDGHQWTSHKESLSTTRWVSVSSSSRCTSPFRCDRARPAYSRAMSRE